MYGNIPSFAKRPRAETTQGETTHCRNYLGPKRPTAETTCYHGDQQEKSGTNIIL